MAAWRTDFSPETWIVCCAAHTSCAYAGAPLGAVRFRAADGATVMALPAHGPSAIRHEGATDGTSRNDGMEAADSSETKYVITTATSLGACEMPYRTKTHSSWCERRFPGAKAG